MPPGNKLMQVGISFNNHIVFQKNDIYVNFLECKNNNKLGIKKIRDAPRRCVPEMGDIAGRSVALQADQGFDGIDEADGKRLEIVIHFKVAENEILVVTRLSGLIQPRINCAVALV